MKITLKQQQGTRNRWIQRFQEFRNAFLKQNTTQYNTNINQRLQHQQLINKKQSFTPHQKLWNVIQNSIRTHISGFGRNMKLFLRRRFKEGITNRR